MTKKMKDKWVQVRLSEEEKADLTKRAEKLGLSLSAYIRMELLYKKDKKGEK